MHSVTDFLLVFITAFALSLILFLILLPLLKKFKAGQFILGYVAEHKQKSGTPTMGGLAFITAAIAACLIFTGFLDTEVNVCLAIGFAYMVVGFLDDFIKIRYKDNQGLKAYQKIIFQLAIALVASIFAYKNGFTEVYVPFFNRVIDLKWGYIPLAVLVFIFITNSVNLTDGLDGLAGGVSFVYFAAIGLLVLAQRYIFYSNSGYSVLAFAVCGSLLAFLIFNTHRASVFMGDTGSLSLGGLVAGVSILSGNMLFIPLIGIMFVVSSISVILQVLYFKRTKKRIFLMAPLHHHFQKKGHSEAKITYMYTVITAFFAAVSLLSVML